MEYLVVLLITFIIGLFFMQLIFFEITRKKMVNDKNMLWFLSLKKPFQYNRVGYMAFICFFCYLFASPEEFLSVSWFIYFVLFLGIGIISDAIVHYLILQYSHLRCRRDITEAQALKDELDYLAQTIDEEATYEVSPRQYYENDILRKYLRNQDHLTVLSVDQGKLVQDIDVLPEATFIIEPYSDIEKVREKFTGLPVKVSSLTPSKQLPLKDEKMDVVMCQYSNYDKFEVQRILKPGGYFITNQNGTANLKEFRYMYMPFRMKGSWDAFACAQTLENSGMAIVEKIEDYGTLRFSSISALYSYFKEHSTDIADIEKYQTFYMRALKEIKEHRFYEMTTHRFLVVSQKTST